MRTQGLHGTHNAGVEGSSPSPATVIPSTWARRLKCLLIRGTTGGINRGRILAFQRRRSSFPTFPVQPGRHEAAVHPSDHRNVTVAELPCDQFEGGSGTDHPNRQMMPAVVEAETGQSERSQPIAVVTTRIPTVDSQKHPLTRCQ